MTKELEASMASHTKEVAKVTRAKDKIIKEYKEANLELQKRIGEATSINNQSNMKDKKRFNLPLPLRRSTPFRLFLRRVHRP